MYLWVHIHCTCADATINHTGINTEMIPSIFLIVIIVVHRFKFKVSHRNTMEIVFYIIYFISFHHIKQRKV